MLKNRRLSLLTLCFGLVMLFFPAFLTVADDKSVAEGAGPAEIFSIGFENIPAGSSFLGDSITLMGEVTTSGSIVSGGSIEATGMVCGAAGCIGDPVAPAIQEALIVFDVPSGTPGGSAPVAGVWVTRELNTIVYDLGGFIVALSGDQILLEAGTYMISANQSFQSETNAIRNARGRFRDVTNDTTVAISMNSRLHAPSGTSGSPHPMIPPTVLTIESLTGFELQYYIETAHAGGNALGHPSSTGENERYAYVHIRKL